MAFRCRFFTGILFIAVVIACQGAALVFPWYFFDYSSKALPGLCDPASAYTLFTWKEEKLTIECDNNGSANTDDLKTYPLSDNLKDVYETSLALLIASGVVGVVLLIPMLFLTFAPRVAAPWRWVTIILVFLQLVACGLAVGLFIRHPSAAEEDYKNGDVPLLLPCNDYWCDSFIGKDDNCMGSDSTCVWGPFIGWWAAGVACIVSFILLMFTTFGGWHHHKRVQYVFIE